MDLQGEVHRTLNGFVARVAELARHESLETLRSAFAVAAASSAAATRCIERRSIRRRQRSNLPRRTPVDLEALAERFMAFVQANPGMGIEQINMQLGTTTKALILPIRRLKAAGVVETSGHGRAMTYFATRRPGAEPEPAAELGAHTQRIEHAGERAVEAVDAVRARDAWYSCFAGVFALAQRLKK